MKKSNFKIPYAGKGCADLKASEMAERRTIDELAFLEKSDLSSFDSNQAAIGLFSFYMKQNKVFNYNSEQNEKHNKKTVSEKIEERRYCTKPF